MNIDAIITWLTLVKFKFYGFIGLKTWLLVLVLALPDGTLIQERHWVWDMKDCYAVAKPAAEELWNKHDKKGDVGFLCIDRKNPTG